jgi:hypothetical protein
LGPQNSSFALNTKRITEEEKIGKQSPSSASSSSSRDTSELYTLKKLLRHKTERTMIRKMFKAGTFGEYGKLQHSYELHMSFIVKGMYYKGKIPQFASALATSVEWLK